MDLNELFLSEYELSVDIDGIWCSKAPGSSQTVEMTLRDEIAAKASTKPQETLQLIGKHHSIQVMRRELLDFLTKIPHSGVVLDVGVGWGWHWLEISKNRPDLTILCVDLSRRSLLRAKELLSRERYSHLFFIHGDATNLGLRDRTIDGYWSVQTIQHIPNRKLALTEAYRILKEGGQFASYSLNSQLTFKVLSKLLKREYVEDGINQEGIYLARASEYQRDEIESIFKSRVRRRYSEVLFTPEAHFTSPGSKDGLLGRIDKMLSKEWFLLKLVARQCSFHAEK